MCSNIQYHDGNEFACRVCNECITARKNDWVARCMAEKATSMETLVFTLTYRNTPDGEIPARAKAFHYKDVQDFLKLVREAYYAKYDARGEIRYIIAGERGSQRDRVHWHMVIFADKPLTALGKWERPWYYNPDNKKTKDLWLWQYWEHGHVDLKTPDQSGMAYVLKYALKDQFNVVKSKGTMREAKAENHGASYFRMSKVPPIGFRYLRQQCDRWEELGAVPPKLQLQIPNYSGYWWPKGMQREYLLQRLHYINEKRQKAHGRDCPQWNTLLSTVADSEKDWEGLFYGPEYEKREEEYDEWEWQRRLNSDRAAVRRQCGGVKPCRQCRPHKDFRREVIRWWEAQVQEYVTDTEAPAGFSLDRWYRAKRQCNDWCQLKDHESRRDAFDA